MEERLRVIAESIGFQKVAKDAQLVARQLKSLGTVSKGYNKVLGLSGKNKLNWSSAAELLGFPEEKTFSKSGMIQDIDKSKKALKGFYMQYLSTMFMGLQVWRTFSGFFKSMIQSFKDLDTKGTSPLSKALVKLDASFTFLKYSILDAMGPAFAQFIMWLADVAMWIADLDPNVLAAIGWGIGAIALVGLAMFTASQVALFANAARDILSLSKNGLIGRLGGIGAALAKLGGTIAIGFSIADFMGAYQEFANGNFAKGLVKAIAGGLEMVGGLSLLQGKVGIGTILVTAAFALKLEADAGNTTNGIFQILTRIFAPVASFIAALIQTYILDPAYNAMQVLVALFTLNFAKMKELNDQFQKDKSSDPFGFDQLGEHFNANMASMKTDIEKNIAAPMDLWTYNTLNGIDASKTAMTGLTESAKTGLGQVNDEAVTLNSTLSQPVTKDVYVRYHYSGGGGGGGTTPPPVSDDVFKIFNPDLQQSIQV